jgi:hypothetical protein
MPLRRLRGSIGRLRIKPPAKEAVIPAGRYAVCVQGTGAEVPAAWGEFFGQLHAEGKADAGACFERYPADYAMDPATGVFERNSASRSNIRVRSANRTSSCTNGSRVWSSRLP